MRTATALLAVLSAVALWTGCGEARREAEPAAPWQRIDLWIERPQVEIAGPRRGRPFERRLEALGPRAERDQTANKARFGQRAGSQVRALAQQGGTRLAWTLELPADGYLSFIPLGSPNGACRCTYRAGVRDADGILRELYRAEVEEDQAVAPATVELDLEPFGGTPVEIIFQVDPIPGTALDRGPTPWALWGSPAIYGRRSEGRKGAAAESPADREESHADSRRPNIVLLGFDTLRADALGPRAIAPTLTPALDRLAAESDVWAHAYSAFNVTNPSFASIMTGLWGKNHGIYDLVTPLPEAHQTLAEVLSEAGYRTLAIVAARHLGPRASGLGQGFDEVVVSDQTFAAELVVDMAIDYLDEHLPSDQPVFVWLHLFDPHTPHTPPQPYALGMRAAQPYGLQPTGGWLPFRPLGPRDFTERLLGGQRDLYDGEVAYLDRQVDRLLGFLENNGHLPSTLVAAVADHGENLGDHGIDFRHAGLWDSTTHVPMMIRWPEAQAPRDPAGRPHRGRRFDGLVQSIDLYPTLLAAAGLEGEEIPSVDGRDLRQGPSGADEGRRAVFAEHAHGQGEMVRTEDFKLILSRDNPTVPDAVMLYDLHEDPGETHNLAGTGHPQEEKLLKLLERWHSARRPAPNAAPAEMSEEDLERLKALGYL